MSTLIGVGLLLGYRPEGGAVRVVLAAAPVVVFAGGLSWVFMTLGLLLRSPNAITAAGTMVMFPMTFLSNVFVSPETLPAFLEAVVDVSPISSLATAARAFMEGSVAELEFALTLGTAAALTAVFAPLSTRLYRRA